MEAPPEFTVPFPRQVLVAFKPQSTKEPRRKSLSWALLLVDDRVSTMKLLRHGAPPNSWVTLIPPSKKLATGNCPAAPAFGVYAHTDGMPPTVLAMAHAI